MTTNDQNALVPIEHIAQAILVIRGQKVIIDTNLAALYGVTSKRFNEQVRRNLERFPADFMFQLTENEWTALRSQFATLKAGRGQHRKYLPYAFTKHGAIMAATILNSPRAIEVSVYVVRAFVELRELLAGNKELALKLAELESRIGRKLDSHDQAIAGLIDAIRELMRPPEPKKKQPIGFVTDKQK
jgi:phage regulator Rha-like protein